jgi:Glycosyltransferase family 6.
MIGVLLIATGKYDIFVEPLISSLNKHFLPGYQVKTILFADKEHPADLCLYHKHEDWPAPTLNRYKTILSQRDLLEQFSYLFYMDVDMLAVGTIGDEILYDLVAVEHPGFVGKVGTPERRSRSAAYIPRREKSRYYAGGFQGGSSTRYLAMCDALHQQIESDRQKGITAIWHDESHLNKYLHYNKPGRVLSPSYCYPESWDMPYVKRLVALDKDHKAMR